MTSAAKISLNTLKLNFRELKVVYNHPRLAEYIESHLEGPEDEVEELRSICKDMLEAHKTYEALCNDFNMSIKSYLFTK